MTTTRKAIGSRRIPIHDHIDLNSGGKLTVSGAIVGGLDVITGSIPPSSDGGSNSSTPSSDTVVDLGDLGSSATVDVTAGTWFTGTLTADCTITVAGFAEDAAVVAVCVFVQDATGGWSITWDTDVTFAGNGQPAQAIGALTEFILRTEAGDSAIRGTSSNTKWEAVTGGEDVFVWDGDDLVYDWSI